MIMINTRDGEEDKGRKLTPEVKKNLLLKSIQWLGKLSEASSVLKETEQPNVTNVWIFRDPDSGQSSMKKCFCFLF